MPWSWAAAALAAGRRCPRPAASLPFLSPARFPVAALPLGLAWCPECKQRCVPVCRQPMPERCWCLCVIVSQRRPLLPHTACAAWPYATWNMRACSTLVFARAGLGGCGRVFGVCPGSWALGCPGSLWCLAAACRVTCDRSCTTSVSCCVLFQLTMGLAGCACARDPGCDHRRVHAPLVAPSAATCAYRGREQPSGGLPVCGVWPLLQPGM